MIRVRVELVRGGDEEDVELLGELLLSNDLQTSIETEGGRGAYEFAVGKFGKRLPGVRLANSRDLWRRGRVEDFDRRKRGPWDLIYLALVAAGIDRRNPS